MPGCLGPGCLDASPVILDRVRGSVARLLREEVPVANKNGAVGRGRPSDRPSGTWPTGDGNASADSILARLKRDDPDMAQAVIDGHADQTVVTVAPTPLGVSVVVIGSRRRQRNKLVAQA